MDFSFFLSFLFPYMMDILVYESHCIKFFFALSKKREQFMCWVFTFFNVNFQVGTSNPFNSQAIGFTFKRNFLPTLKSLFSLLCLLESIDHIIGSILGWTVVRSHLSFSPFDPIRCWSNCYLLYELDKLMASCRVCYGDSQTVWA